MAYFPKMTITNAGLNLLTNVQAGADTLTFTKMVLGDGDKPDSISMLSAVVNPILECEITVGKNIGENTYQIGAYFSNANVTKGFWWREVGVYAKGNNGKEILYCYTNAGDAGDYIPLAKDERVEKYIYNSLAVGNAENVTIEVNESEMFITEAEKGEAHGVAPLNADKKIDAIYLPEMDYADRTEFATLSTNASSHMANKSNPHGVTAAQVGLGNVPNVSTNDQTPTYTEATTLTALTSGEKINIAFGKIKKAITDLISHLADTTKHITSTERSTWNAKAPTNHASTGTTYGVGTSSNYGHLKITDSLTSAATDTAASAKALKEVSEKATGASWQLIKEYAVSLDTGDATSSVLSLSALGELFTNSGYAYDELKMELRCTINGYFTANNSNTGTISVRLGDSGDSPAQIIHIYTGACEIGKTWTTGEMFVKKTYPLEMYHQFDTRTAPVSHSFLKRIFVRSSWYNGITGENLGDTQCALAISKSYAYANATLTGTLKVYAKGV